MGWSFRCDPRFTKADLVAELTSAAYWGAHVRVLASAVRGSHLWQVIEKPDGQRFIALDLLRAGSKAHGEGWGHKDLCESMGPCEVDCPLSFLDMAPMPDSKYAAGWRESVREHHAHKAQRARFRIEPGARVSIYGKPYTVIAKRNPRGWIVQGDDGKRYRATRGIEPLAQALPEPAPAPVDLFTQELTA
jgi:hypothetical protein